MLSYEYKNKKLELQVRASGGIIILMKKYITLLLLLIYYLPILLIDITLLYSPLYVIIGMLVIAAFAVFFEPITITIILKNLLYHVIAFLLYIVLQIGINYISIPKYRWEYFFEFGYYFFVVYLIILYSIFSLFYIIGHKFKTTAPSTNK